MLRNQAKWLVEPSDAQIQHWSNGDLTTRVRAIASDLGLYGLFEARGYARPELDRCLANQKLVETIARENAAATQAGVAGTPSFLIDGQLQDSHDWAGLRPQLEAATR